MGKPLNIQSDKASPVRVKPRTSEPCLRDQQRVEVRIQADINRPGQPAVSCRISNLSRAGMMITCTGRVLDQLLPSRRPPAPGDWLDASACFEVPVLDEQTARIRARCHLAHLRRVARDEFQLGLRFVDFEGRGFDYVDRYIHRALTERAVPGSDSQTG